MADTELGLDQTSWTLTGWGEQAAVPTSVTITADFADGKLYGTSGVNRYNCSVTTDGPGVVSFGPVMSTMMAGPEEAMTAEQVFVRRLEAATGYRLGEAQLVLTDAAGADSLSFTG